MRSVGIRELRQNLSRYIDEVRNGESFVVTERGREVARLTPSGPEDSALARIVAEHGATWPRGSLTELDAPAGRPAGGPPSEEVLADLREDRP
jgi:prevent-host-death family protein